MPAFLVRTFITTEARFQVEAKSPEIAEDIVAQQGEYLPWEPQGMVVDVMRGETEEVEL